MDTLAQHNPTCDLRTYAGGQIACHHEWILLDADQEVPWANITLEYHLKFRYWVQGTPRRSIRSSIGRLGALQARSSMMCRSAKPERQRASACIRSRASASSSRPASPLSGLSPHFHCHAPTCLSIKLFVCDPSVHTHCANQTLLCEQRPLYGGKGHGVGKGFDEPGYIAQPPCLWGKAEHGLAPPPVVSGANLYAVSETNNTYGHHGEMAWLQVFLASE